MNEIIIKNPCDPKEFEKAMKLFKKKVNKEGFLQEVKERKYYIKPSERKRLKRKKRR